MSDRIDYEAYAASLRQSQDEGTAAARAKEGAIQSDIDTQEVFSETLVQFGVALAKLNALPASHKAKASAIGTTIGNMMGDVLSSYIKSGRIELAAEMLKLYEFARDSVIDYRLTGASPEGTVVSEAAAATDFKVGSN